MSYQKEYTQEYLKDLLGNRNTQYNDTELEANVKNVSISSTLIEELIIGMNTLKGAIRVKMKDTILFNMLSLTPRDLLWEKVELEFPEYEFASIRVQRYEPTDMCEQHRDNIHKGYSTFSIRLNEGDSRFYVGSKLMEEKVGEGYLLPENTLHSVNTGKDTRYSLVAWLKLK